jgi:hypothetical protein
MTNVVKDVQDISEREEQEMRRSGPFWEGYMRACEDVMFGDLFQYQPLPNPIQSLSDLWLLRLQNRPRLRPFGSPSARSANGLGNGFDRDRSALPPDSLPRFSFKPWTNPKLTGESQVQQQAAPLFCFKQMNSIPR